MKYFSGIFIALLVTVSMTGCSSEAPPAPREESPVTPSLSITTRDLIEDLKGRNKVEASEERAEASPKQGWNDFNIEKEKEAEEPPSTLRQIALWFPNRALDFIDIFRVDVGVGPAVGGVVRVTKWAQAGLRTVSPASVRVGDFGRTWPAKIEHSSELGISPAFLQSGDRTVCPGELGVGIDLFLAGGYAGICFDELADFVGGIFLADIKDDDLK